MKSHDVPDTYVDVNQRTVSDTIGIAVTSGGRIALSIELATGEYFTTYLTPDEWDTVSTKADDAAMSIRTAQWGSIAVEPLEAP